MLFGRTLFQVMDQIHPRTGNIFVFVGLYYINIMSS